MSHSRSPKLLFIAAVVLALVTMSCQLGSFLGGEAQPTSQTLAPEPGEQTTTQEPRAAATSQPDSEEGAMQTETAGQPQATEEVQPTAEDQPQAAMELCSSDICVVDGSFLLDPPLGEPGRKSIDTSNRFGRYQASTRDSNRGVNFVNSTGISVVAAADGSVVVAGDDLNRDYGAGINMYGNLVILEHHLAAVDEPVYTLYAHLSEIQVEQGDEVSAGQEIGKVGMSGSVKGSTLHFEVRLGENSPKSARNPELWLKPLPDEEGRLLGALAGRIINAQGDYQQLDNIVVERIQGSEGMKPERVYLKTYGGESLRGRDPWRENFAAAGLPAGDYKISFMLEGYKSQVVTIKPGKLTHVTFQVP
jgi:murein DD-endopeptidase MepM/ murein hydrolase activator NlpD